MAAVKRLYSKRERKIIIQVCIISEDTPEMALKMITVL